jgi:thioesterase domain-containing protein
MRKEDLEKIILNGIPISNEMAFRVQALDQHNIVVTGAANENSNIHNTAFAGSVYSICSLAAWGLTFSKLPKNCTLVMAKAKIQYVRPVLGDIVAKTTITPAKLEALLSKLNSSGKANLSMEVIIESQSKQAVKFYAYLHVKAPQASKL